MHRQFRTLLDQAEGHSQFVISLFADIRSFSTFSQSTESPDTAMFIKRVYAKLIDTYFSNASFYKPTGDGLMIIIVFTEQTLTETTQGVVDAALRCHEEFKALCVDDPMINFPVPQRIGFGIARGTACRLHAGDTTLDYSGRLLNLSARLMNLARPSGIVIDGDLKITLLQPAVQSLFAPADVYLRGIAESTPKQVFLLKSAVTVPPENLSPMNRPQWKRETILDLKKNLLKTRGPTFSKMLAPSPTNDAALIVEMRHDSFKNGQAISGIETLHTLTKNTHYTYSDHAGQARVQLQIEPCLKLLSRIPPDAVVRVTVHYPVDGGLSQ